MKHKRHRPSTVEAEIAKRDWFAKAQWAARKCIPEKTVILQIAARDGEAMRIGGNIDDVAEVMRMLEHARQTIWAQAQRIASDRKAAEATRETIDATGAKP